MNTKIHLVIDELYEELQNIKAMMDECINDWDFLGAYDLVLPYEKTISKLHLLRNIEDPNYSRKIDLKNAKDRLINHRNPNYAKARMDAFQQELDELETIDFICNNDGQIVKALEDILHGHISKFELEMTRVTPIIQFTITENSLALRVISSDPEGLDPFYSSQLIHLGFAIIENGVEFQSLELKFKFWLELLMQILFDVFNCHLIDKLQLKIYS